MVSLVGYRIDEDLDLLFVKNKNHMDCKLAKRKATLINGFKVPGKKNNRGGRLGGVASEIVVYSKRDQEFIRIRTRMI